MTRAAKVTQAGQARIEEVCRQREAIPSDKELAIELGVSHWTITKRMHAYRNGQTIGVSRGATRTPEERAEEIALEFGL